MKINNMTQKEKAKAYDEALERAIKHHNKDGLTLEQYETIDIIFPELKESEDERIKKRILLSLQKDIMTTKNSGCNTKDLEKCIAWLEKQGEHNPANKVKPKFKVGDWIVYYRNDSSREVLQVYDIRDGRYYFTDNVHFSWSVKECDEKSHLWTIQDAKEGDVLSCGDKISCPFIFHNLTEKLNPRAYCGVNTLFHFQYNNENCGHWCYSNEVRPSTKEECDLLFAKMKEAGYEWDANKKELKLLITNGGDFFESENCEQKPAWSEEDEKMLVDAYVMLDWYKGNNWWKIQHIKNWLKSLKERIGGTLEN